MKKEEAHFFYFSLLLLLLLSSSFSAATHLLLYISIFPFYLLLSVIPISFNMYLYDTCFFIVFLLLYYIYTDGAVLFLLFVLIRTSCSLIIQMTMILHYQPYMIESNGRFVASIVVLHLRCKEDPFFWCELDISLVFEGDSLLSSSAMRSNFITAYYYC